MSRASNFIGKPVIIQSGKQIETVDDVIFDPHTHTVLCFSMSYGGGWLGGTRILPWSDQLSIAPNALIVASQDQIILARTLPHMREILEKSQVAVGKKLMSPDNRLWGTLSEVHFEQDTGKVRLYEITHSAQDSNAVQSIILQPDDVDFQTEDRSNTVLIISNATAERIENHVRASNDG